ncbi:uncharacterized protein [Dendrobates tinctorius]|uniref:uncharacterized protein n=1 Tax=Dendrobates tinctorius TaxID=92724 RepID=UPI003CC985CF
MDAKKFNTEYSTAQNNGKNDHLYHTDKESILNGTHKNDDQKMEPVQPQHQSKDSNLLKRVNALEVNIKSMTKTLSSQGEDIKSLLDQLKSNGIKYEKALERQFNNMTTALNSLQNRLEEGLELSFSQISQLRDDVYFIENALNRTKQERLGENETTMKSTKSRSTVQSVTEPQTRAPLTTFVPNAEVLNILQTETIWNMQSTALPLSKEKEKDKEHHAPTSFLKTRADFQVFFYGADKDADGYLTYAEIKNVLGEETPSEELLEHFDTDQDAMFSYMELMRTFLLED